LKNKTFTRIALILTAFALSGCLEGDQTTVLSSQNPAPPTAFAGATGAVDTGTGLQIKISWGAVPAGTSQVRVMGYNPSNGMLTPIATLPATATFYSHTGLTSGTQYSYVVQALDSSGNPDSNQKIVSALAYSGINQTSGGISTGTTAATLFFSAPGLATTGANLFCKTNYTGDAQVGTATANQTSAALTGLLSGTNYTCHVQAISSTTGLPDNNTQTFSFQTISVGYTQSSPAYQGVILVQAYGDAPNAPTAASATFVSQAITSPVTTPTSRIVNITWKNFAVTFPSLAAYRLIRVATGGTLSMNTTTLCTSTTSTACQVCINTSSSNTSNTIYSRTCSDSALADPTAGPVSYDYAVSLIVNPSTVPQMAEEMAAVDTPFRVAVHIPPQYMVLVHRDSANYQMCNLLGSTPDPLNHQRCAYGTPTNPATGATTYSSQATGLNPLPSNCSGSTCYYDFGYNLFVDRFTAGCNWTAASLGGDCGAGGSVGNCYGSAVPSNTFGANGNVYWNASGGGCYMKVSNVWTAVASLPAGNLSAAYTNVPSRVAQPPALTFLTAQTAWNVCQSIVSSPDGSAFYGPKRLMRRREEVVAAAFQAIQGEPGALSVAGINSLQNGTVTHPNGQVCNSNNHLGVTNTNTFNSNTEIGAITGGAFMIGSDYTAACVSRFGAQDLVGNTATWVSDTMSTCSTSTHTCTGGASTLGDLGNRDLANYNFDGTTGPGGTAAGQVATGYTDNVRFNATNVNFPLGLPFVGNDRGNAIAYSTSTFPGNMLFNEATAPLTDASNGTVRAMYVGSTYSNTLFSGAWSFNTGTAITANRSDTAFRCALPAQ
jgi:hypothetical protein